VGIRKWAKASNLIVCYLLIEYSGMSLNDMIVTVEAYIHPVLEEQWLYMQDEGIHYSGITCTRTTDMSTRTMDMKHIIIITVIIMITV
jgi:hypothetical protein